jgi:protein SCO1
MVKLSRRQFALGAAGVGWAALGAEHALFGPVDPRLAPPSVPMLFADSGGGPAVDLASWLVGRPTAMQLMFTQCTTTCPLQGALFGATARRFGEDARPRLLSVSIDPEHDTPAALRAWMARFGASAGWYAASPRDVRGADAALDFVRGRAEGLDRHTLQVACFDAQGRLAYRTAELPSPAEVLRVLAQLG